jgi:hypothetical protein
MGHHWLLANRLPNAHLRIYLGSNHTSSSTSAQSSSPTASPPSLTSDRDNHHGTRDNRHGCDPRPISQLLAPNRMDLLMRPTILLVHGAFAESASWNRVIDPCWPLVTP